ncbi:hypothetical protein C7999DRAFT_18157, partial [Corynascus novoguineensis]
PVIVGKDIKSYRYPIHKFDFAALDGKDKWTAYRFTKNVYDTWMPKHFENICPSINQLPSNLDFDVPPLSEAAGLSQDFSQSSIAEQQAVTPDTSFSGVKRRKGRKLVDVAGRNVSRGGWGLRVASGRITKSRGLDV